MNIPSLNLCVYAAHGSRAAITLEDACHHIECLTYGDLDLWPFKLEINTPVTHVTHGQRQHQFQRFYAFISGFESVARTVTGLRSW